MFRAVLSNPQHPEQGQVTVPFPLTGDAYCQAHLGQTLEECCADYLAEQSQESPEMQM